MKNICEYSREYTIKIINFKKKKNQIINKRAARIIWKCKNFVKFVKQNLKINIWKIKNIVKLEVIVITQGNKEVLRIAYVIENIVYLKKSLQSFIIDLIMITIL